MLTIMTMLIINHNNKKAKKLITRVTSKYSRELASKKRYVYININMPPLPIMFKHKNKISQ